MGRNAGESSCLHLGGGLWQISSSGKNPVLFRYLQRESRIRSQILEQLETAPKAEAVTARIFGSKGGGAADRCCVGRI